MLTTKVSEYTLAGLPKLTVRLVALASLVLQDLGLRTERSSNYVPVSKRGQKKKKKKSREEGRRAASEGTPKDSSSKGTLAAVRESHGPAYSVSPGNNFTHTILVMLLT